MVPTATTFGRLIAGAENWGLTDALLTPPLCLISAWVFIERHAQHQATTMYL
jgi:hypothetical protein